MSGEQVLVLLVLAGTVALFIWGRWRHDVVALSSLLACVLLGLVPAGGAFEGFGHPAVITVACVLVLSRALQTSGAVDSLARRVLPSGGGATASLATLMVLAAALSSFMNNVGALALLMPVCLRIASRHSVPPGRVLMPVAFGSILGGMTTLIGTPPNLIVSGFREAEMGEAFGMFAFTPVGAAVAGAGVVFLILVGWRLVPSRERPGAESFVTGGYLTEVEVVGGGRAEGRNLAEIGPEMQEADAQVVGMVREGRRVLPPHPRRKLREGDILVVEAEPENLAGLLGSLKLRMAEDVKEAKDGEGESDGETGEAAEKGKAKAGKGGKEGQGGEGESAGEQGGGEKGGAARSPEEEGVVLVEVAVRPQSKAAGRTPIQLKLRTIYRINLLALSRKGSRSVKRLRSTKIRAGDVLLLQGTAEAIQAWAGEYDCIPLAERPIHIPDKRQALLAGGIMAGALAAVVFGWLPAAAAFALGVLAVMALRVLPLRSVYEAVDWPVVVLLGALIPVAGAMASTGAADRIASWLVDGIARGNAVLGLAVVLVVSMTLSDFMNNAATAAVMCPIALSTAAELGVRSDSFLMAVAVGASCAFLTPIGHQNNTLILGPGGFRFGDYWRAGLPIEIIVVAVGVPMLLLVWPP